MRETKSLGDGGVFPSVVRSKGGEKANPYVGLPPIAYWKSAVAEVSPLELNDIYTPRFPISRATFIATAGSCFAQHIARQFKTRGYKFLDVEPPPPILDESMWRRFGYDQYSGRFGNVYSVRQLLQMFKRAYGVFMPKEDLWMSGGRFYDPFRPSIEPDGFATEIELRKDVLYHLNRVRTILPQAQVFVFTFGLTEAWVGIEDGAVYPTCPGTVAGAFDPQRYRFHNFTFSEIIADIEEFIAFARQINPTIRFLFTVSPVPLTATATGGHVLQASVYSKSVLRAVCGEIYDRYPFVDYFPSYELVASHPFRAMFFDPNLRTVTAKGVSHVMNVFFSTQAASETRTEPANDKGSEATVVGEVACDEAILEIFGP